MGGKEIEFEVERRREDRTPLVKDDSKRVAKKGKVAAAEEEKAEPEPEDGSWTSYFENQKTIDNMKFFVFAQSFVMFLTYGLPQLQRAFTILQEMFYS